MNPALCFLILAVICSLSSAVFGGDASSTKAAELVKSYLLQKDPSLSAGRLEIDCVLPSGAVLGRGEWQVDSRKKIVLSRQMLFPLERRENGKLVGQVNVAVQGKFFRAIPLVEHDLRRGVIVQDKDLRLQEQDLLTLPKEVLLTGSEVVGKEVKSLVRKGSAILPYMVREVPTVRRGDRVNLTVKTEEIEVSAVGEAMDEGRQGEKIRVRNLDSKKMVEGTIVSSKEVAVGVF